MAFGAYAFAPKEAENEKIPKRDSLTVEAKETEADKLVRFLSNCESQNDPNAKNPKDADGTPSYGRFQFKPDTLYGFAHVEYGILPDIERTEIMNVIYDGDLQEQTLRRMIDDPHVNLRRQFPHCYSLWIASQ